MNGKLDALGKGLSTIAQACRAVVDLAHRRELMEPSSARAAFSRALES